MKLVYPESIAETPLYPGLRAKNFKKNSLNGFGDRHNAYPHSMTVFKDHLYVGTTRSNLHMRGIGRGAPDLPSPAEPDHQCDPGLARERGRG